MAPTERVVIVELMHVIQEVVRSQLLILVAGKEDF